MPTAGLPLPDAFMCIMPSLVLAIQPKHIPDQLHAVDSVAFHPLAPRWKGRGYAKLQELQEAGWDFSLCSNLHTRVHLCCHERLWPVVSMGPAGGQRLPQAQSELLRAGSVGAPFNKINRLLRASQRPRNMECLMDE